MFFIFEAERITPLVTGVQWGELEQVAELSFIISLPAYYLVDVWGSEKTVLGYLLMLCD